MKAERLVLRPVERGAEPGLASTADSFAHRMPAPSLLATLGQTGMLAREAQESVPLPGLAELHQGHACQPALGQERTLGQTQSRDDALQQGADDGPLSFLPGVL